MNLQEFKLNNPGINKLRLMLNASQEVIAMTINTTGCNNVSYGPSLQELESVVINGYEIFISEAYSYSSHWAYDTVPSLINPNAANIQDLSCMEVTFRPFIQGIDFTYNDYNATLGNSSEIRRFNGVYEVDYKSGTSGSAIPSNLTAILSGSAVLAPVQESNYTSVGLANSKYNGAKTSIIDYGVNAALAATPFTAAVYLSSSADDYICSQSFSDRTIQEYLFTGNEDYPTSGSRIFIIQGNKVIPLRNKKVWGEDTTRVFYVDKEGYALSSGSLCGI